MPAEVIAHVDERAVAQVAKAARVVAALRHAGRLDADTVASLPYLDHTGRDVLLELAGIDTGASRTVWRMVEAIATAEVS